MAERSGRETTRDRVPRRDERGDERPRGDDRWRDGLRGPEAARRAREQLAELTGRETVSVSGLRRTDDGWEVTVEVVELERVPPTTNVMGSYEVELDPNGDLVGYELVERYHRGQVGGSDR